MPSIINSDDGVVSGTSGLKTTGGNDGLLNIQTNGSTAMSINASQQVTFNNGANLPNTFGFKNRIINGGMVIDQRNAGAEVNPAVSGTYYLDRWQAASGAASKFKIGRNAGGVTPPAGFSNYLGCTSLSAYSVGAGEAFQVRQPVEANNVADLAWGTANAVGVTVSFWVYSSLTGTFGGAIRNATTYNYSYPFTYSVSAANTWEYKTISIPGPTAGTWGTGTSTGFELGFSLGSGTTFSGPANAWASANYTSATGATSVVGTNGATFYITGVQLERGSTATSFDFRSIGTELALCQRYYESTKLASGNGWYSTRFYNVSISTANQFFSSYKVSKRATPTLTLFDTAGNSGKVRVYDAISDPNNCSYTLQYSTTENFTIAPTTSNQGCQFVFNADAEL